MSSIDEFLDFSDKILYNNIGFRSKIIIDKAKSKIYLNETSNLRDFEDFINLLELDISVITGKYNAMNICNTIKSKALEINISKQAKEIFNNLKTESIELSISEFLKNIYVGDVCAFNSRRLEITGNEGSIKSSINTKMKEFLEEHTLPTEGVINRFATYIAYKFCEDVNKVKKEIIEKIKDRVKNILMRKAIREDIINFLKAYPQPTKSDVDDFVNYSSLSKMDFHEAELRQQILDEILYHKFYESKDLQEPSEPDIEESSELSHFLDIIRTYDDKKDIIKEIRNLGVIYLIEDESGVLDRLLNEYIYIIKSNNRYMKYP